ncbi:hypothetical protein [Anaerorhabdus sp.]|uniref:hypothetical protein n=1 Tax=Anaerorhabdus sp. TaxID=1872524 RepID=UPI002FCC3396
MTETINFVGYEYKNILIESNMEPVYIDGYRNFGWIIESATPNTFKGGTSLIFKRDRKIRNKAELIRLGHQFDACVEEIIQLERTKNSNASIVAFSIGILGCAFMALSVFSITATTPNVLSCIVFAIPGFLCWIIPYFCYCLIQRKKTNQLNPLIDKKYDDLYEVCEKANSLLS